MPTRSASAPLTASATGRTMAAALADAIRDDIIRGELAPGSKLAIKELARRYAAGAIPVREALSRLANTGFVDAQDQRGFRVSTISEEQLRDITDTRVFVETEAVRRSVQAGSLAWEEQVVATHHRLSRIDLYMPGTHAVNPEWRLAHDAFHAALGAACSSPWLLKLAGLLREQTERYRNFSVTETPGARKVRPARRDIAGEHEAMMRAALSHEADKVAALLAQHIRRTSDIVLAQR